MGCVLDQGQVAEFATRGFVLLPRVVPMDVVAAAAQAIDELIEREPPGADIRGPHNYFLSAAGAPELAALLAGSPAFGLAESLTGPGTLEMPWQVQVALNIPPFPHRPGLHHIDGFPPEPDGRPGTFTMLAGVLMSGQRGPGAGNLWVWPGTHLAHAEYFRSLRAGRLLRRGRLPADQAARAGADPRRGRGPAARALPAGPQHRRQHLARGPARGLFPGQAGRSRSAVARFPRRSLA